MAYPLTRVARQAKRREIRERKIARAEVEAFKVCRSIVCGDGLDDLCAGAANCLCECHDSEDG